ncbi:MAG: hypothetical protein CMJ83_15115 [Planctomycetes bacterium]|nr:hypothetical protein [Planctomycetota bacterium]
MRPFFSLVIFLFIVVPVCAQGMLLCGEATPNPAAQNQVVSVTVSATQPGSLASGCGIIAVRQDSPFGPIVYQPSICPAIFITVGPPPATVTLQWSTAVPGGFLQPGMYYIQVDYRDQNFGPAQTTHFPVRIDALGTPPPPILSRTSAPVRGTTMGLSINAPGFGGSSYLLAASFQTNVGFTLPTGLRIALDQDALFPFSFPAANPFLFPNFLGNLDASGNTNAPAVNLPNLPVLNGFPLAIQGALFNSMGALTLTNPITVCIE